MRVKAAIEAGGGNMNHNETLVRAKPPHQAKKTKPRRVKTGVRAGGVQMNHNHTLVRL